MKPDQASKALSTAVSAGANEGGWIQWVVEDPSAFQAKVASEAVANARKAAEQIAAKSGVHLGRLMNVMQIGQSGGGFIAGPMSMGTASAWGMGDGVMMTGGMQAQNQQFAINSRRVEFRASVTVTFEMADEKTASNQ